MWSSRREASHLMSMLAVYGQAAASGSQLRGVSRLAQHDEVAGKRERRKQRRQNNRELKEKAFLRSFGWQWSPETSAKAARTQVVSKRHESGDKPGGAAAGDDFSLFQSIFGKPKTNSEHRRFSKVWGEWQKAAAAGGAHRGNTSSSSRNEETGTSGHRKAGSRGNTSSSGSSSSNSSMDDGSRPASSGGKSRWAGTTGASAGPRWGQASFTWADFEQGGSGGSSSTSQGGASWDEEAWYEPPPSGRGRKKGGGSSDSSGSSSSWGWHSTSWQHSFTRQFSGSWPHSGSSQSSATGGSFTGGSSSSAVHSNMQLLGLERSWLASRCSRLLRRAYLAKAKSEHPDVHAGSGNAAAAERKFKEVQAAYQALLALVVVP